MRAVCVCAIVVFHVELWLLTSAGIPGIDDTSRVWGLAQGLLNRVRLPGLLLLSGMLVSRRLLDPPRAPGRDGRLHRRLDRTSLGRAVASYYLYVVWLGAYWLVFAVAVWWQPGVRAFPHLFTSVPDAAAQLAVPATTLWYLLALALYVLAMVVCVRAGVPPIVVVVASVALALVAMGWDSWAGEKIASHAMYFVVGVYLGPRAAALARMRWWWVLPTGALFVATTVVGTLGDIETSWFGVAARVASMPLVLVLAVLGARWAPLARFAAVVGRRTLCVYVLHPLLLLPVWWWVSQHQQDVRDVVANPVGLALVVYGGAGLVVVVALAVETALRRVGGGAVFAMPSSWQRAVAGAPSPPAPRQGRVREAASERDAP